MALTVEIISSPELLDPIEWDSIVPRNALIQRHAYLLALAHAAIGDCEYRYFICRDETQRLVAHASFYAMSTPLDAMLRKHQRLVRVIRRIRRTHPTFLTTRVVECGSPAALGSVLSFSPKVDPDLRRVIWAHLVRAMDELRRARRASLLVLRDFGPSALRDVGCLQAEGFYAVPNLPNTTLALPWRTFDDYLAALKSRYRTQIARNIRRAASVGIRRQLCVDFKPYVDEMARLYRMTHERAREYQREELSASFFASIDRHLGDRAVASLFWCGERLVGFCLYLVDDDVLTHNYLGVDYDFTRDGSLVLNAYYDGIRTAIEMGKACISFGFTTYAEKLALGATIEPICALIRSPSRTKSVIAALLHRRLTPMPAGVSRDVFRLLPGQSAERSRPEPLRARADRAPAGGQPDTVRV